jgi:hypothetical protein
VVSILTILPSFAKVLFLLLHLFSTVKFFVVLGVSFSSRYPSFLFLKVKNKTDTHT